MNYFIKELEQESRLGQIGIVKRRRVLERFFEGKGFNLSKYESQYINKMDETKKSKILNDIEKLVQDGKKGTLKSIIKEIQISPIFYLTKTALVLSGGGTQGTFQIGVLLGLKKFNKLPPKWFAIYGTSTGSINALVLNYFGNEGPDKLAEFYLKARDPSQFFSLSHSMNRINNFIKDNYSNNNVKMDLFQVLLSDKPKVFVEPGTTGFLSEFFFWLEVGNDLPTIKNLLEDLSNASGIFTLAPLKKLLDKNIGSKNYDSDTPVKVTVVDMITGEVVLKDLGTCKAKNERLDWTLASASQPGIFETYRAPGAYGHFYTDGGVRSNIPIHYAKEDGAQKIIAILTEPLKPEQEPFQDAAPNITSSLLRFVDCAFYQMHKDAINPANGFNDDIERDIIEPLVRIHDSRLLNPGLVRMNIEQGYVVAAWNAMGGKISNWLQALFAYAAIIDLFKLRKEIHELERSCMQKINYKIVSAGISKNKVIYDLVFISGKVDVIRSKKREVYELMQMIYDILNKDPFIFPFDLPAVRGVALRPTDWWLKWEGHWETPKFRLDDMNILIEYPDPWAPLPINFEHGVPVFGSTVVKPPANLV